MYKHLMRISTTALAGLVIALGVGCAPALLVSARPDAGLYPEPSSSTVTFWGHASVYLDVNGYGIVTDPVFGDRFSPFHGRRIPTPPREAFDQTRLVLVSHAHQDHLQPGTLARFDTSCVILCPAPSEKHVRGLGPKVRVMRPGDEYFFPGGSVVAVVADHPGGRWSRKPRTDGGALGYVIRTPYGTVYYSGDTEYFDGFKRVGAEFRPDLAILNVNVHLKPAEALRAMVDLGSPRVIASHMGAYGGSGPRGRRWNAEFLGLAGERGVRLDVGESASLDTLLGRPKPVGVDPDILIALANPTAASIGRFVRVEPGLYRGAKPHDVGLRHLRDRGIRSVVSFVRDDDERRRVERLGMRYFEIPLHAGILGSSEPTRDQIRSFLALAADTANRPLYFHCRHGKDRTGAMAALYRIEINGWRAENALVEMRALGASRFYKDLYRPIFRARDRSGS